MKCYCIVNFREALAELDMPIPEPKGAEVLLKVKAAGVCHSDIHLWEGGYDLGNGRILSLQDRGVSLPLALGHETVGTLEAMGPDAKGVEKGRNYLAYPWIGCGECATCRAGRENYCAAPRTLGILRHGGYAEYLLVPDAKYLIDIGDLDPAQLAPYACSGLTTFSALKKIGADTYTEHPILIFGAGGLGLMSLQLLKALGGKGAVVVDIDPVKREAALKAGALAAIDGNAPDVAEQIAQAMGGPAQAAIDLVGAPATSELAFNCLAKGGKLVIIGLFGGLAPWSMALIPIKAIQILGSFVGNLGELQELIELVKTGKVPPMPIETFALNEADEALSRLRKGGVTGRAVLMAS
ncbi:alcohol dehydrogenase [Castellaniella sp.]|uniref:alcohol dehydrogenase n=1 Tax=Castellaniella sp. TaxID=1955812 RepID=UPI00355E572B